MPAFDHSAAPSSVPPKYRDPSVLPTNIMKDPRVAKGSTFGARARVAAQAQALLSSSAGGAAVKEKVKRHRPAKKTSIFDYKPPKSSKDDLDLAQYLVEQTLPVPTSTASTQSAAFMARPLTPDFVPQKTGVDASTQLSDEVFDFDVEVGDLLGVIVSKTMEQALIEVEEEAELETLDSESNRLAAEREMELERIRQLEKRSAKEWAVKKERVAAERQLAADVAALRAKVCAVRMMKEVLPVKKAEIYEGKVKSGEWIVDDIKTIFMPWLLAAVEEKISSRSAGHAIIDGVIEYALQYAVNAEASAKKEEEARLASIAEAEAAARRARVGKVKINITAESLGLAEDKSVGPIEITGADTVGDLEEKILSWLDGEEVAYTKPEAGFLQLGYGGEVLGKDTVVLDIPGGELNVVGKTDGGDAEP